MRASMYNLITPCVIWIVAYLEWIIELELDAKI